MAKRPELGPRLLHPGGRPRPLHGTLRGRGGGGTWRGWRKHDPKAEELIDEGRAAFRKGDRATGWKNYEEVVERAYAAKRYRIVRRWLENRD